MRTGLNELQELAQEALRSVRDCDSSLEYRVDALIELKCYAQKCCDDLQQAAAAAGGDEMTLEVDKAIKQLGSVARAEIWQLFPTDQRAIRIVLDEVERLRSLVDAARLLSIAVTSYAQLFGGGSSMMDVELANVRLNKAIEGTRGEHGQND